MKRNCWGLLLVGVFLTVGIAGVQAAPNASEGGKELLIKVVGNSYPPNPPEIACEDFIPAFSKLKVDGRCSTIDKKPPQIAFIGDSHIAHYRPSALTVFKNLSPMVISQTECFPFTADDWRSKMQRDATCGVKQDALLAYLSTATSIKTVVLSARWSSLMSGQSFQRSGDGWLKMSGMSPEAKASFIKNGQHFINTLLKAGKQVVVMRDIPDLDFEIGTCYDIRPVRLGKVELRQNCSMAQAPFEPRRQIQNAVLDEVLKPFPRVKVYDPVPVFCQKGICKASDGVLPYYLNADHVNNYGAELVFKDFVPKVFPEWKP
jgi:hypothetical protein